MCPPHPYGGVPATVTIVTDYGQYHVCDPCADFYLAGHFALSKGRQYAVLLSSENPRQRCQCEHADHTGNPERTV